MTYQIKAVAVAALLALAGCSGGGSGGAPATPSAESQIPASFSAAVQENSGTTPRSIATFGFTYASPSDTLSGAGLTGPDAALFQINIFVTDAGSNRVNVQLELVPLQDFDFESPADANRDNVYELTLGVQYNTQTISRTVTITVTDVAEPRVVQARWFSSEFSNQDFAERATVLPDVTSDGVPEIGVSVVSNRGERSTYLIASETYADGATGGGSIGVAANVGSFVQSVLPFDSTDLFSTPPGFARFNLITGASSASGADILVSESAPKQLTLFRAANATPQPLLTQGADTQTSALPRLAYTIDAAGFQVEARMIGDVNGDGANDIFAQFIRENLLPASGGEPFYRQKFGVIFGETGSATAATITSTALDIELIYFDDFEATRGEVLIEQVPDITGDGRPEYVIGHPEYAAVEDEFDTVFARGAVFLIRSEALNATSGIVIDLRTLTSGQGVALDFTAEATSDNRIGRSLSILPDFDNDGSATLFFTDDSNSQYVIDANDFLAMPSQAVTADFIAAGGARIEPTGSSFAPIFPIAAGDINGDGTVDLMSPAEFGADVLFYDGAAYQNALAAGGGTGLSSGAPIFTVDLTDFGPSNAFFSNAPLFIPEADIYAVSFLGDNDGSLVIIERQDVIDALANSGFTEMFLTR